MFLTDDEYKQKHGITMNIQAEVETHTFAMGGSNVEDQAAIVGDGVDCLVHLNIPNVATNGVEVHETLRFFTGDQLAVLFEQGTQEGSFKCACGCSESMFDDQAHSLRCHWPLDELQQLAISGLHGRKLRILKPFDRLLLSEE